MGGRACAESDVLRVLDEHAARLDFPMLDNPVLETAEMRLTAFRSPGDWLIVFQELGVLEEDAVVVVLSAYSGVHGGERVALEHVVARPDGRRLLEAGRPTVDVRHFELMVHGSTHRFRPTPAELAEAGADPGGCSPLALLRLVCRLSPVDLLLRDVDLPSRCRRGVSDWRVVGGAGRWHHPNVAGGELPSGSPCLRRLAMALAGDATPPHDCPEHIHNTPTCSPATAERSRPVGASPEQTGPDSRPEGGDHGRVERHQ